MNRLMRISVAVSLLSLISLAAGQTTFGQLRLPRPSPKASVMQTVGVTDITITYHRPAVKGRKIWGDPPADAKGETTLDNQNNRPAGMAIVPYGHIWRTGANDATQFVATDDVLINGQPLPAGSYSLHTVPGKDEWTIVFNGTANQWGSFNYDASKDTLRVKAKPQTVADNQEWLAFDLEPGTENTAIATISWEKVRVPFTVEVKDVPATTLAKARTVVSTAKTDDWRTPLQAANYAKQNKADKDAGIWFEQALKANDEAVKAKASFPNLAGRANILLALGRKEEAITTADKAIETGKAEKADYAGFEKRFADVKAGKN